MKWLVLVLLLAACPRRDVPKPADPQKRDEHTIPADDAMLGELPPAPPVPRPPPGLPDAPVLAKVTPEQVALGELLFWDARLSTTGKLACATCHDPAHGFAGGVDVTAGGQPNLRRTPALVNVAWQQAFGWDGRYQSLDDLMSVHVRGQMGQPLEVGLKPLAELPLYRAHLARAGDPMQALEAYVLTRFDGDSPWDRLEATARTPKAGSAVIDPVVAGYLLFAGKARCATCHRPPLYMDGGYHVAVRNVYDDKGRGLVDPPLANAFKTPTLRGAAARTRFFHTGAADSLSAAIVHGELEPVALSAEEKEQLLAFVAALTHVGPAAGRPPLP